MHPSADAKAVATAAFCGAYEFQGQKCSAASRMYIPKSLWPEVLGIMKQYASEVKMGDVRDHKNYINAVIDEKSWDNIDSYIAYAEKSADAKIVMGGGRDKSVGYFVEPTVIETTDPHFKSMEEEIFGPVLTVFPYDDDKVDEAVKLCDTTSPYGLTGAVFGKDRLAVEKITDALRYAAGNFYINDKPTGAVVGNQPFGHQGNPRFPDRLPLHLHEVADVQPGNLRQSPRPPPEGSGRRCSFVPGERPRGHELS